MLSALGRGFHEIDIRFTFHTMMPLSLRDYVQETGRGGHDFQQANCTLFFSFYDKKRAEDVVGLSGERCRRLQGGERVRAEDDLKNVVNYAMAGDAGAVEDYYSFNEIIFFSSRKSLGYQSSC